MSLSGEDVDEMEEYDTGGGCDDEVVNFGRRRSFFAPVGRFVAGSKPEREEDRDKDEVAGAMECEGDTGGGEGGGEGGASPGGTIVSSVRSYIW